MKPEVRKMSPREFRLRAIVTLCQEIRAVRRETRARGRRARGATEAAWRKRRASKLRAARVLAWEYFTALPEVGSPGCCRSPWVFESIRPRR